MQPIEHRLILMLILLSPAKTLDFESPAPTKVCTQADFLDLSQDLIKGLSKLTTDEISDLMGLSPKLAKLNHDRYNSWSLNHDTACSRQAIFAFKGDVYEGLQAWNFQKKDFDFAQSHLRILSGLYGMLRPLDLIQPYRLEMGTLYPNPAGKDLYSFWGDRLKESINQDLLNAKTKTIVNLASLEYAKAARFQDMDAHVISPVFKDEKAGKFKIISFYAKRARGMMANFIISNKIINENDLENFASDGYFYSAEQSTPTKPVFLRTEQSRAAA